MNDHAKQHNGGRVFRVRRLVLAAVLVPLALAGLFLVVHRGEVEQRVKALRAVGYPTSFAELAEHHQLPDGAENAADTYVQAFAAFRPATDSAQTLFVGQADLPPMAEPLPEAVALATGQFLIDNRTCLESLREAGAIEHCRYDWDYAQDMPYLTSMKRCAQLLASAVVLRGYEGDGAAALAYFADGLHLARSLQNEPGLICYLVRVACTGLNLSALERTLSVTPFTDEQLALIDRMVAETTATLDVRQTLISERCFMIERVRDPSLLERGHTRAWTIPGLAKLDLADILDYMADCIEAVERPPAERLARFREINDELEDLSFLHVIVKTLAPGVGRVAELDLHCKATTDLARTALAIERCRLATGTVPDALEQLVPDYLDHVPIDPYDGRAIRYQRTDPGYRLYHVFADGQDNGGLGREEVKRGQPYDWPFIVTR